MKNKTSQAFVLPDQPSIPGLMFRHLSDESEYVKMADITNAVRVVDQLDYVVTAEDMANWFGPDNDFDPHLDIIFAEIDGNPVAFGTAVTYQETSGVRVYLLQGRVLPAWRRKGLGRAILHHNEQRLRAIAAAHPPGDPRTFLTYSVATAAGTVALLTQEGYQPVRHYYHMVCDTLENIPHAPLPDGLEVRPALAEHYRQIWEAEQDAFQDHWGYFRATEDDYQRWLKDPNFDPTLWRVAWECDQVVGQVHNYINGHENEAYHRQRGYTENISVRVPWRRRGVARALIAQSL
jgi:GNAT superfamily N-acetyltransferase